MKPIALVALLAIAASPAHAFYEGFAAVEELTPSNFNAKVINSDSLWIVEFYAPWCGM